MIVPQESGEGIQIGPESLPTFGWRDILGQIELRGIGAADPSFATYTGTPFRQFSFSPTALNEVFIVYHIPHDYLLGSDVYFHAHWSNAAATPDTGNVRWGFQYVWARGFNQAAFAAGDQATATATVVQACPATRYQHMIAETGALQLAGLEVDSLILMRLYRDAAHDDDTCTDAVFVHTADIHYQSTNVATKNKAPNFYV